MITLATSPGRAQLTKNDVIRIGIVGCGAVTERAHLPICQSEDGVKTTVLVDPNRERASALSSDFDVPIVATDISSIETNADAVILAAPHSLHAPLGVELLRRGLHVLVEKPMATSYAECSQLIETAEKHGSVLAVGLMRRFAPWARFAKDVIERGLLGTIRTFKYFEGKNYSWPAVSDSFFSRKHAGGGVLMDTGAHTLDTVLWLFGDHESVEYFDDSEGGVEADCELHMTFKSGVKGLIKLSRIRNIGDRLTVYCEHGELVIEPNGESQIRLNRGAITGKVIATDDTGNSGQYITMMRDSFCDWVSAIRTGREPFVNGREGSRSISLIEQCYASQSKLTYPWEGNEIVK